MLQIVVRHLALGEDFLEPRTREPGGYVAQDWEQVHRKACRGGSSGGLQGSMRNHDTLVILVHDIDTVDKLENRTRGRAAKTGERCI